MTADRKEWKIETTEYKDVRIGDVIEPVLTGFSGDAKALREVVTFNTLTFCRSLVASGRWRVVPQEAKDG